MGSLLSIAVRNLRQNRKRTLLLGSAISSVTLLLVLLVSMANGVETTMLRAATTLATGHVNVAGFYKVTSGQAAPVVTKFQPLRELVEKEIPEVKLTVDRVRGWGRVVSDKTAMQLGYAGVDIDSETTFRSVLNVLSGDLDKLREPRSILLFESQAKKLGVSVGDPLTLSAPTARGAYNSLDTKVVAIAADLGFLSRFNIIAPKETVREMYLLEENATGAIQLYLHDHRDSVRVAERLRTIINDAGYKIMDPRSGPFWTKFQVVTREPWTGQKIDVTTWEDELEFMTWALKGFDSLTAVLIGILLIIIVVGVMNSLWMTIRERTREIGTLRAIGMARSRVLAMFMMEAAVLSVAATLAGALLGVGLSELLNVLEIPITKSLQVFLMSETLQLLVEPIAVVKAIAIISTITTVFALYPASRAARMPPITAIQNVG